MAKAFGVESIQAVGAFFTTLRARYEGKSSRKEALHQGVAEEAVRKAYQHVGCFNLDALPWMDQREGATSGDQFQYQLNKDGSPRKTHWHVMPSEKFEHFMEHASRLLCQFGDRILNGEMGIEPFLHRNETPCERCDFTSVCRIDPWTQPWRNLEPPSYGNVPQQES
jgi:ATP-dependent helicase/DNAse subunit B